MIYGDRSDDGSSNQQDSDLLANPSIPFQQFAPSDHSINSFSVASCNATIAIDHVLKLLDTPLITCR